MGGANAKFEAQVLKAGTLRPYEPGSILIASGENTSSLFFVVSGEVAIMRGTDEGLVTALPIPHGARASSSEMGRRGKSEVVGELAFLLDEPASATVMVPADAKRAATVVFLERKRLVTILKDDPKLCCEMMQFLSTLLSQRIASTYGNRPRS